MKIRNLGLRIAVPLAVAAVMVAGLATASGASAATHSEAVPVHYVMNKKLMPSQLIPASATGCVGINPWNYVETCIHIDGSGAYVDWMQGTGCTKAQPTGNPTLYGHEELTGPGHLRNGPNGFAGDGTCLPDVSWTPYASENPGQYCVTTWVKQPNKSFKNYGRACATVS
jgi:hypothetical protein